MTGYVYFLSNPEMPDILKVGYTRAGLAERLRQLDTTGVPREFNVIAAIFVTDPEACEKAIHEELSDCRVRKRREFFRISAAESFKRTNAIIQAFLPVANNLKTIADTSNLDKIDQQILAWIFHKKGREGFSLQACWEFGFSEQEGEYRLGELALKGYLKDDHGGYPITHKGIKFVFENGLAIDELLDYGND